MNFFRKWSSVPCRYFKISLYFFEHDNHSYFIFCIWEFKYLKSCSYIFVCWLFQLFSVPCFLICLFFYCKLLISLAYASINHCQPKSILKMKLIFTDTIVSLGPTDDRVGCWYNIWVNRSRDKYWRHFGFSIASKSVKHFGVVHAALVKHLLGVIDLRKR